MMILVAAIDPIKELLFPEAHLDWRGRKHAQTFIQSCKRTIKALMEELDLQDMHRVTKSVIDEHVEDRFVLDAVAKPLPPETEEIWTKPKAAGPTDKNSKEEKDLKAQQEQINDL